VEKILSSEYQIYACGKIFTRALILNQNPNFARYPLDASLFASQFWLRRWLASMRFWMCFGNLDNGRSFAGYMFPDSNLFLFAMKGKSCKENIVAKRKFPLIEYRKLR